MSAYNASPPVIANTTEPSTGNSPNPKFRPRYETAW
jgi:hypothetical protein